MLGRPADDGACAMDQLAPEIVVGASSDAAEPWLAASCILPGHQSDPGCHLAARAKLTAIVDAADDRSGNDRPHPRQLCEPPTSLVCAAKGDDHRVELLDPAIQVVQLVHELAEDCSCQVRQVGTGDGSRRLRHKAPWTLRQHDPVFGEEAAGMIDQSRSLADQPVAGTMKRLQVLLVCRLHGHEAHRWTHRCFEDRLRVDRIVLRSLDEGLYETRIDETYLAAGGEPASTPMMRACTRLHRDCRRCQVADHLGQLRPADLLRQDDPVGVNAVKVERSLAEIDPVTCFPPVVGDPYRRREAGGVHPIRSAATTFWRMPMPSAAPTRARRVSTARILRR